MRLKIKENFFLAQQRPLRNLIKRNKRYSGRNKDGKITVRHQGGGVKQLYRMID